MIINTRGELRYKFEETLNNPSISVAQAFENYPIELITGANTPNGYGAYLFTVDKTNQYYYVVDYQNWETENVSGSCTGVSSSTSQLLGSAEENTNAIGSCHSISQIDTSRSGFYVPSLAALDSLINVSSYISDVLPDVETSTILSSSIDVEGSERYIWQYSGGSIIRTQLTSTTNISASSFRVKKVAY